MLNGIIISALNLKLVTFVTCIVRVDEGVRPSDPAINLVVHTFFAKYVKCLLMEFFHCIASRNLDLL